MRAYHLHGKPGNSGWKIKWLASFRVERFVDYGPLVGVIHFCILLILLRFEPFSSSVKPSQP